MNIRRPEITIGGVLLAALLVSTAHAAAQTPPPTLQYLHHFTGGGDSTNPHAGVVIGQGGVLYGTTSGGNVDYSDWGTVFSLTPPASPGGAWTESVLYKFSLGIDGGWPLAGVVIGRGRVLYGTARAGGAGGGPCGLGCGIVFSLTPPASPGAAWTETVLHDFNIGSGDGAEPYAGVVIGPGGVLYGTTFYGGSSGAGTVFSLTPPASPGGAWTESALYSFSGGNDGSNPYAGVVIGPGGVLYGTTGGGGTSGNGTVFSLTPPTSPGGAWKERVLYSFTGSPGDGAGPTAGVLGSDRVLYGTTQSGGTSGSGTVFSLTPPASPGGAWTESVLYSFTGGDGAGPYAGVVVGTGGVLYGTTQSGGTSGGGTVFSLTPPTSPGGAWTESVLYSFTPYPSPGSNPWARLVIGKNGVLYGTTADDYPVDCSRGGCGTVFALKP